MSIQYQIKQSHISYGVGVEKCIKKNWIQIKHRLLLGIPGRLPITSVNIARENTIDKQTLRYRVSE